MLEILIGLGISNCYNIGALKNESSDGGRTGAILASMERRPAKISNCGYLDVEEGVKDIGSGRNDDIEITTWKFSSASDVNLSKLPEETFIADSNNPLLNGGYPVLFWQKKAV